MKKTFRLRERTNVFNYHITFLWFLGTIRFLSTMAGVSGLGCELRNTNLLTFSAGLTQSTQEDLHTPTVASDTLMASA
jgi:hypothetical protein